MSSLPWYIYLLQFVAGMFLANGVPHFVQGISGNWFQTPFASPSGVGESSPVVNVLWGLFNMIVGALLFHVGRIGDCAPVALGVFFIGITAMSIMSATNFTKKHAA